MFIPDTGLNSSEGATMYVFYFDIEDFIAGVEIGEDERMYVQESANTRMRSDLPMQDQISMITLTAAGPGRTIHAARIEIERISRMSGEGTMGSAERAELAYNLVVTEIKWKLPGAELVKGMLLEAGMMADLDRLRSSQDLWRIEQTDKHDPRSRRLTALDDRDDHF
jgi:hypothetical protein